MDTLLALEAGLRETGWAIFIDRRLAQTGSIACPKRHHLDASRQIDAILQALDSLIATWKPRDVAYTGPFRNQWPVPALDHLEAALRDWAQRHQLCIHLYEPREVRAGIVGKANAPKEDLAYNVMRRWGLVGVAKSTAEWEAVAAGDYHLQRQGIGQAN